MVAARCSPVTASCSINDSDPESDPLTAHLYTGPSHGTVNVQPDGTFDYTHDGSATNADSFTYRAFDGTTYSSACDA